MAALEKHDGLGRMSRAVSHHCPLFQLHPSRGGPPWGHAVPWDLPPPPGTPCPVPNPLLLPLCPGAVLITTLSSLPLAFSGHPKENHCHPGA